MSPKRSLGPQPDSEEETPLLRKRNAARTETPLPTTQVVVLLFLQLSEPIVSQSIKPYITQVCRQFSLHILEVTSPSAFQ
jgi:hypothetical protein